MERKETTVKHYSRNKGFSCPPFYCNHNLTFYVLCTVTHKVCAARSSLFILHCVSNKTFLQEKYFALGTESPFYDTIARTMVSESVNIQ